MIIDLILVTSLGLLIGNVVVKAIDNLSTEGKEKPLIKDKPIIKDKQIAKWDNIQVVHDYSKCPKCGETPLVYSMSNVTRRVGSKVEYYYCLRCKMDTAAGSLL